ncbi:MAG TPA: NAD(P)-dependent oxidoreductase, partial [Ardenticatenaceae bacterium]|nr:NAD(P)-dependent oxidoreductase [Ardenticatenaceae bacterium]
MRKEQVVAILTRGRGRVTRHLMEQSRNLQVVARCGVGLDNIDLAAANERRVPVVYAPNSTTTTVAEHTFMLILAAARRLCPIVGEVRAGNWGVRDGYQGVELAGKTVGIVGMGAIGSRVAALAEAFGMRVTYWSPSSRNERYEFVPFESLLREADIVTLHVALNGGTHHLIGARELALMKPGAVLVNTARGAIVAQPALAEALAAGRRAGYAKDVLEQEPPGADEALL